MMSAVGETPVSLLPFSPLRFLLSRMGLNRIEQLFQLFFCKTGLSHDKSPAYVARDRWLYTFSHFSNLCASLMLRTRANSVDSRLICRDAFCLKVIATDSPAHRYLRLMYPRPKSLHAKIFKWIEISLCAPRTVSYRGRGSNIYVSRDPNGRIKTPFFFNTFDG